MIGSGFMWDVGGASREEGLIARVEIVGTTLYVRGIVHGMGGVGAVFARCGCREMRARENMFLQADFPRLKGSSVTWVY